jgi:hypothetical protein
VIHFFDSVEQGAQDLPRLLAGEQPLKPTAQGVGTANYARPPQVVMFGKGFTSDDVAALRQACGVAGGQPGALWLTGGLSQGEADKLASGEVKPPPLDQYGPMIARKVREACEEIKKEELWGRDAVRTWKWD